MNIRRPEILLKGKKDMSICIMCFTYTVTNKKGLVFSATDTLMKQDRYILVILYLCSQFYLTLRSFSAWNVRKNFRKLAHCKKRKRKG